MACLRTSLVALLLLIPAAAAAHGVWLDVPFVKQEKNGCGAAVVAMLMQYWSPGRAIDPAEIHRTLYAEEAKGAFASDLVSYLQDNGYRTFAITGGWQDLKNQLQKGRPLVVALGRLPGSQQFHYVLVTGIDWRDGLVMFHDPAANRKLQKMDRRTFEKAWKGTGNWLLLAVPAEHPD